jgi:hypothetical protein
MVDILGYLLVILLIVMTLIWLFFSDKIWTWLSTAVETLFNNDDVVHY